MTSNTENVGARVNIFLYFSIYIMISVSLIKFQKYLIYSKNKKVLTQKKHLFLF